AKVFTQDKQNLMISAAQPEFTLQLKSNPTTGYSWFLREYNESLIVPVKHVFQAPQKSTLMGAPGLDLWTFKMKPSAFIVPQQTLIRLVYARPWQSNDGGTQLIFRISTGE